jgi:hypothetical protein
MNIAELIFALVALLSAIGSGIIWLASRRERKLHLEESLADAANTRSESWGRLLDANREEILRLQELIRLMRETNLIEIARLQKTILELRDEVRYLRNVLKENGLRRDGKEFDP